MAVTHIFFDFGGTLARSPATFERPWKVWVEVSREQGLHLSETLVRHAIEAVDEALEGQIYGYVGRTPEYWKLYDGQVMDRLRIRDHREDLSKAIDTVFGDPSRVEVFSDARPVLETLRSRGYHLGLISNHNDGLLKILEYHSLSGLLESVTYSQEAGAEKPAPEIFARALGRAKCTPTEALHVGDSISADVEGARRSGLQAIWLNRDHRPGSVESITIRTLDELPHVLEMMNGADELRTPTRSG